MFDVVPRHIGQHIHLVKHQPEGGREGGREEQKDVHVCTPNAGLPFLEHHLGHTARGA